MLTYIIAATFAVSLISLVGVILLPVGTRRHRSVYHLVGFATGALLSFAFFDLLPEALESGVEGGLILKVALGGIVLFFVIEQIIHYHHCRCHTAGTSKTHLIVNNLAGDAIHNFIDGTIIAGAFLVSVPLGIGATVAVALHEIPQEVADFSILIYAGMSRRRALAFNFLSAASAIAGGILVFVLADRVASLVPFLLAAAAGNFIYLAMADLIPELHEEREPRRIWWQLVAVAVGVGLVYVLTVWLPG